MKKNLIQAKQSILCKNNFQKLDKRIEELGDKAYKLCFNNDVSSFYLIITNFNQHFKFGLTPLNCYTKLFSTLWQSEYRSSNLNVKAYNFFFKYHDSAMRTSFYDFLLKTRLLQDEKSFAVNYKQRLMKTYRWAKVKERNRYRLLWEKYGLIEPKTNFRKRGKGKKGLIKNIKNN